MNNYETIAIFKPEIEEKKILALSKKIEKAVSKKPGKFIAKDDWGVKKLSYEIQNEKKGRYVSWKYETLSNSPKDVDQCLRFEEDVLRYITYVGLDTTVTKASKKKEPKDEKQNPKIDFRNPISLARYVSDRGKIIPRRLTGVDAVTQRLISREVKRARQIALMAYTSGIPQKRDHQSSYEKQERV